MCPTLQRQDANSVIIFVFAHTLWPLICCEAGVCIGGLVGVGEALTPSQGQGDCQETYPVIL